MKLFVGQARIQAMLMRIILERVVKESWARLETAHVDAIMAALAEQYAFGSRVNSNAKLHEVLEISGNTQLQELLQPIEFESMVAYLHCLFHMHAEAERDVQNRRRVAEQHLMRTCYGLVKEYIAGAEQLSTSAAPQRSSSSASGAPTALSTPRRERPLTQEQRSMKVHVDAKVPIIVMILEEFAKFRDDQFAETLPVFYELFCELILSDSRVVRAALRSTLTRIGRLRVNLTAPPKALLEATGELSIMPALTTLYKGDSTPRSSSSSDDHDASPATHAHAPAPEKEPAPQQHEAKTESETATEAQSADDGDKDKAEAEPKAEAASTAATPSEDKAGDAKDAAPEEAERAQSPQQTTEAEAAAENGAHGDGEGEGDGDSAAQTSPPAAATEATAAPAANDVPQAQAQAQAAADAADKAPAAAEETEAASAPLSASADKARTASMAAMADDASALPPSLTLSSEAMRLAEAAQGRADDVIDDEEP